MHKHLYGLYILRSLWITVWRWESNFPDILSSHLRCIHVPMCKKKTHPCSWVKVAFSLMASYSFFVFFSVLRQLLGISLTGDRPAVQSYNVFKLYSVGVRKASVKFRTACQLPALLPSCRCNAMYHSHFLCSIGYAVIKKKGKTKPKHSHHHIYVLVCITSCLNCTHFHWVIFNHFPSVA